jgi:predicted aspartyl protease
LRRSKPPSKELCDSLQEWDVTWKQKLQAFLAELNPDYSAFGTPADTPREVQSQRPSSQQADVPLSSSGGVFAVPVEINGTITLEFAVDSGASDVIIPLDVFSTLKRTGTIRTRISWAKEHTFWPMAQNRNRFDSEFDR